MRGGPKVALLRSALSNPGTRSLIWLFADRACRLGFTVITTALLARKLGASNFGVYAYEVTLVAIFQTVTGMGMDALGVREIVREKSQEARWVGTIVGFRIMAAVLAALLITVINLILKSGNRDALAIAAIMSVGMIFQSLESSEIAFQARTKLNELVLPRLLWSIAANLAKVFALSMGGGLYAVSGITTLEVGVSGMLTWMLAKRRFETCDRPTLDWALGMTLLKRSYPLALSLISATLYMRISSIIIGTIGGDHEVGLYAAGIRITEALGFVPAAMSTAFLPQLINAYSENEEKYGRLFKKYLLANALIGWTICAALFVGGPPIMDLLFGEKFAAAKAVMQVHCWSLLFVFIGTARSQDLLNKNKLRLSLGFTVSGLVVVLLLNYFLVPKYGALGGAFAVTGAYACSAFLSSFVPATTRNLGVWQAKALFMPWALVREAGR